MYLCYQHIKFDDKTKGNFFEFQVHVHVYRLIRLRPKLNRLLGLALFAARFRSYWDITQIYGNQRMCDKQK